jgi:hypothetical protein
MTTRNKLAAIFGLFAFLFFSLEANAQSGLGVVRGSVQDASQAVVGSAKVKLTNSENGIVREVQSSPAGVYYFGSIAPGPYTLEIEANGFKRWSGTLTVEVGQTVVVDPTLEVGSTSTTIEVTGAAPVITTEGSQVADVKDSLRIHQLPLNQRT